MTVESHTGGAANDRFDGNALPNTLKGGAGNDRLVGADGNDTFDGGVGADLMSGDGGVDTSTYAGRLETLSVVIDGRFIDGGASDETGDGGTPDDLAGTENVIGASRADTLVGDGAANTLTGGPGADTLRGLAGNDLLRAKDGVADTAIICGAGTDTAEADSFDPVTTTGADAREGREVGLRRTLRTPRSA